MAPSPLLVRAGPVLFVNLAAGYDLADVLENFPTLDREDCRKALAQACVMIAAAAPVVDPE